MDRERKTIVVSAVNLRKGGTLTILRGCLGYLSGVSDQYRIVALVHCRELCDFPGIEYIEMPLCIKSWGRRLWAEYVTMNRISKDIAKQDGRKIYLWLSLHDTTPRVEAEHREVYCHNSFPFLKLKARDFVMDPKIPLFVWLTKWIYKPGIRKNDSIIVQQNWFADAMSKMLDIPREKFRVIPPVPPPVPKVEKHDSGVPLFLFASTPDCHKGFETLCEAAEGLERKLGKDIFKVVLTIKGDENRYARWLKRKWGKVGSIDFHGFMTKEELYRYYAMSQVFVFPSRIETWGLPISEYHMANPSGKLLLRDLPYAHEAAEGAEAEFFSDEGELLELMQKALLK